MGMSLSVLQPTDPLLLSVMDRNLSKGCELFLGDVQAREVFINYAKNGDWKDKLGTTANLFEQNADSLLRLSMSVYSDFIFPASPSELASQIMLSTPEHCYTERTQAIADSEKKIKNILLAAIFPAFLESQEYARWIEWKNSVDSKVEIILPPERCRDHTTREERLDDLFSEIAPMNTKDVIIQASASIDETELDTLLSSGKWLANLLVAVENLNFCVSLATARPERRGFPLIYVNKAFEKTTGYRRHEIVGQNCKFLQSEWSEKEQVDMMAKALATAQPIKVALTNRRKDGTGITA